MSISSIRRYRNRSSFGEEQEVESSKRATQRLTVLLVSSLNKRLPFYSTYRNAKKFFQDLNSFSIYTYIREKYKRFTLILNSVRNSRASFKTLDKRTDSTSRFIIRPWISNVTRATYLTTLEAASRGHTRTLVPVGTYNRPSMKEETVRSRDSRCAEKGCLASSRRLDCFSP